MRFTLWCFSMTAWTAHVTVATVIEKNGKFLFVEEHTEGGAFALAGIQFDVAAALLHDAVDG